MKNVAGVRNAEVIDMVTHDPKSGEFVLIMFEQRPWDGSSERIDELQKKLNNYLFFALGGQIEKHYPQALDKPLRFQLDCHSQPDAKTAFFLESFKIRLQGEEINFAVRVL
jgi:hypothetical protein